MNITDDYNRLASVIFFQKRTQRPHNLLIQLSEKSSNSNVMKFNSFTRLKSRINLHINQLYARMVVTWSTEKAYHKINCKIGFCFIAANWLLTYFIALQTNFVSSSLNNSQGLTENETQLTKATLIIQTSSCLHRKTSQLHSARFGKAKIYKSNEFLREIL